MKLTLLVALLFIAKIISAWHIARPILPSTLTAARCNSALSSQSSRSVCSAQIKGLNDAESTLFSSSVSRRDLKLYSSGRGIFTTDSDAQKRKDIKSKLFSICAACDRGFAALAPERKEIESLIQQLRVLNPEKNPTKNLYPFTQTPLDKAPLEAAWRMVYTSARDMTLLASNPLAQVQGVYQLLYRDGSAVNVVNLAPRFQNMLPPALVGDGTVFRLKIFTKAYARNETRMAVSFRKVELKPVKLFSQSVVHILPPLRAAIPQTALFGADRDENGLLYEKNTPSYFDILYLDDECLVTRHATGGYFVGTRSAEPLDAFL